MNIKLKQKTLNGDVWYVWLDGTKVDQVRRIKSSNGGQETFKVESMPGCSFSSIKACKAALEKKYVEV